MTSPAPITAEPLSDVVPLGLAAWTSWLQEQVDPLWRPGEWSQQAWFFDGDVDNPRTSASKCATTSCWTVMPSRNLLCRHCLDAHRASRLSREEFVATYRRPRRIRTKWGGRARAMCSGGSLRQMRTAGLQRQALPHPLLALAPAPGSGGHRRGMADCHDCGAAGSKADLHRPGLLQPAGGRRAMRPARSAVGP